MPLDDKVVEAKVKYYLGAFAGYFVSLYICLYLYSFLRYGKNTATKLYDSSYKSDAHIKNSAITDEDQAVNTSNKPSILADIHAQNTTVLSTVKREEESKAMVTSPKYHTMTDPLPPSIITAVNEDVSTDSVYSMMSVKLENIVTSADENKYSKGYREYVQQQRTLLGCISFLYPDGCAFKVPCTRTEIQMPPGRAENLLLFLCHNHPLLSCFYYMDGSKLGAHGSRILYIGKEVSVFVLYQFSNMLLQYFQVEWLWVGCYH
jgi:hypothetical protein